MNILYKNDNLSRRGVRELEMLNKMNVDKICQMPKKFYSRAGSRAKIYLFFYNKHEFISKSYEKDEESHIEFLKELNNYLLVKNNSRNNILFQTFFIQIHVALECNNYFNILMNKNSFDLNSSFLQRISNKEKMNLLFQALITIYDMNHNAGVYFNDIYYKDNIRNMMVLENKGNKGRNIQYKMNNEYFINVPIEQYQLQIIDYGRIDETPKFRTTEYMKKYFESFYKRGIISEIIVFAFFYLMNCGIPKEHCLRMITIIITFILKKYRGKNRNNRNNEKSIENKQIDYMFLDYLLSYITSRKDFFK